MADGLEQIKQLKEAGFNDAEIHDWEAQTRKQLFEGGFSGAEIDKYFGVKEPDMSVMRTKFDENLGRKNPQEVTGIVDALDAGWQMSVSGLLKRQAAPDKVLGPDAGVIARVLSQSATMAGDLPYMWAGAELGAAAGAPTGAAAGAVAGSVIPGAGTVAGAGVGAAAGATIGGGFGAFALPAGIRRALMDYYDKGTIHDWEDFWGRSSAVFMDALKEGGIGALTAGAGGAAGKALAPVGNAAVTWAGRTLAEVGTMVSAGAVLNGEVPKAQDFLDAAVLVAGLGIGARAFPKAARAGRNRVAAKLRTIYAETGLKPSQVLEIARTDPTVTQDLNSTNVPFPRALEAAREQPKNVNAEELAAKGRAPGQVGTGPADVENLMNGRQRAELSKEEQVKLAQMLGVNNRGAEIDRALDRVGYVPESKVELPEEMAKPSPVVGDETPDALPRVRPEPIVPERLVQEQKEANAQRTPAEQKVLERVRPSQKPTDKGITLDKLITDYVDDLHPIKVLRNMVMGKEKLKADADAYVLTRLLRGNYGRADSMIEFGTRDFFTNEVNGPALKQILKPYEKDLDQFRAYAVAARVLELEKRGITTGVDLPSAKQTVAEAPAHVRKAFSDLQDYQNNMLKYLRDSGVLSKEAYELIREANENYVPFFRIGDNKQTGGAGKGLLVRNPVKAIEGSDRKIIDPIESVIRNTYLFTTLAERNRAMLALTDLANRDGGEGLIKKAKKQVRPISVTEPEVAKFLKDHGLPEEKAEAFNIFRPMQKDLARNEIAVFRDGKREIYEVPEEVASVVQGMDSQTVAAWVKLLGKPAAWLRAGAVLSPEFIARNPVRDQWSAFINSKHGYIPIVDMMSGFKSLLAKDKFYQDWLADGGANAALVHIDRQYIQENVFKLARDTNMLKAAWNVVTSPVATLRVMTELMENATRLGEYKLHDLSTAAGRKEAALASRDITLDFSKIGAKMRAVNQIAAFSNVSIQGPARFIQAMREAPVATMAKITASITLPSIMLWAVNHDDPRYKEIPDWQKDMFWIVMTKDHIYRIPKPFEPGLLFGSAVERTLDAYFDKDPHAYDGFALDLLNGMVPNVIPTAFMPFMETFANRSFFTGNPIVNASTEQVLPEYQYNTYSTESAKQLGKLIAMLPGMKNLKSGQLGVFSPANIENWTRDWSGGLGMYALQIADKALTAAGVVNPPVKPASTLADIPFVKAFVVRYPSAGAESIQRFYERFEDNQTVINTIKQLGKSGRYEDQIRELRLEQNQEKLLDLTRIQRALSNQNKMIQMIYANDSYTAQDKRQLIDGLYYQMIATAKYGNQQMDAFAKAISQ